MALFLTSFLFVKSQNNLVLNGNLDEFTFQKYHMVEEALASVDLTGIDVAIQTMPPFPWHFGGQSFHNLFVLPNEINEFCQRSGYKICLDVSHSMMACNFYHLDLHNFIKSISPHVIHLHIADALGIDGEGVQMGQGNVDFRQLGLVLDSFLPGVGFVPEVWQGHCDEGAGFWQALAFLEGKLFSDYTYE